MSADTHQQGRKSALRALGVGVVTAIAAFAVSTMVTGNQPIQKLADNWTPAHYTLSEFFVLVLSVISGTLFAVFVINASLRPLPVHSGNLNWAWIIGLVNMAFLVVAAVMMVNFDYTFALHIREFGAISMAQAALILIALVLLLRIAVVRRFEEVPPVFGIPFRLAAAAMTLLVFLLLMEEISYGQHFIGWQTPDAFSANIQNETNLHNFYTHEFEVAYYTGATLAFCVFPIWAGCAQWSFLDGIKHVIPPPVIGVAALPLTSLNYETWGIVPLQIQFFLGMALALFLYVRFEGRAKKLPLMMLATMLVCQVLFLLAGYMLFYGWELTEMRELAIAWMILVYAVWLSARLRSYDASSESAKI